MPTRRTQNKTSFKKTGDVTKYEIAYSKRAVSTLKQLISRIEDGTLLVVDFGYWEATQGRWNFRVIAKESEDFTSFEQS